MAATENITVLFTDLVGSTELTSALSPEAGDEVRRKHFSGLRQAIVAAGGTEVKSLGDGLMVVFPAASAALGCAVAMQQVVHRDNAGAQRPLGLRVGLSSGEATREADDYFGDPVVEAARLCARAAGGQILVSDLVRATAGRRSPHVLTAIGALELKGLPEPVDTLELSWEPLGDVEVAPSTVPLPARLEAGPIAGVVARDAELEILTDAFKRVASGARPEAVVVSGDAGLGKTTLVAEAARRGFANGACVLLGRCQEDVSASYAPFAEALHHFVAHAPDEMLTAHVAAHGGELAKMVPALGKRLESLPAAQSSDPDTERYLLFGAVVGLLAEAASGQPVLLILDDLQWADKPSLQLLRHVVANLESARLLIMATFRDTELSGSHPLTEVLAALQRERGVRFIELKGFDDTGVLAFMEAAAGHHLGDDGVGLAHALYRETDGNPFFVGVVLLNLIETGAIYQDDSGRWAAGGDLSEIALPSSVRQVISARVARLGDRAGRILSTAAVIGRDFDLDVLARVTECDEGELLDLLEGASAPNLVRETPDVPGRWGFAHALTQHTLYQDLGATRRARIHRQVAEAIEAIVGEHAGPRVGELAHHWFSATQPVSTAKAIGYARQAGDAALAALAPDDAMRYFVQAMQLVALNPDHDPLTTCDLLLSLGEAQRQAGVAEFRETFLAAAHSAQSLGADDRLVRAALANSRGFFTASGIVDSAKVEVLEAALGTLTDDDSAERAMLLATLCSELCFGPLEQRRSFADEARAMARRVGDPATLVRVLSLVDLPLQYPSALAERMTDSLEALALAEALGDPDLLYWAAFYGRVNGIQAGDFQLGARCLGIMRVVTDRLRQPTLQWATTIMEVAEAMTVGDLERADELATTALQIGIEGGQPDAFAIYGGQLSLLRRHQGRLDELVTLIEQVAAENPGVPTFGPILAITYLEAGDDAKASELLEAAAAEDFTSLPLDFIWLVGTVAYARVAFVLGALSPVQKLYDLLSPYSDQVVFVGTAGGTSVALHLGGLASALGRYDEAEAYFAQATELDARGHMKCDATETDLWWGWMLASRRGPGDLDRARLLLERARDVAATNGYAGIGRRATAELSKLT
jgi:class 3 adenylate cyclase/tetratricopeptide (TPR) repeat protein